MNFNDPRFKSRMEIDSMEARILRDRPDLARKNGMRSSLIALAILLPIFAIMIVWAWLSY